MSESPYYSASDIRRMIEHSPQAFQDAWRSAMAKGELNDSYVFTRLLFLTAQSCAIDPLRNRNRLPDAMMRKTIREFLMDQLPSCLRNLQASGRHPSIMDLTQIISAFDMLAIYPNQRWQSYILRGYNHALSEMDGYSSLKLMRSLRVLAVYPGDELIEGLWDKMSDSLEESGDNGIDELVYSLAVFDYLRGLDGALDSEGPCQEIGRLILDVHRDHFDEIFPDGLVTQQVRDAAMWFDHELADKDIPLEGRGTDVSKSEDIYRREFMLLGVGSDDYYIQRMTHKVDMRLYFAKAASPVHLFEVDGKYHFNQALDRRTLRYNGPTMFRTALMDKVLQDQGAVLLRVPDYALREFNLNSFRDIVKNANERLMVLPAGAYVMQGLDQFSPASNKEAWVVPTLRRDEIFRPV